MRPMKSNRPSYAFLWLLILAFALFTRFYMLDEKVLHHDESLFAYYSLNLSQGGGYSYDPLLHGPFLIDASALMLRLFGKHTLTLRLLPTLMGIGLIGLIYSLRHRLSVSGAFISAILIATSPTFMYYSRFMRNDIPFAFGTLLVILAMIRFWEKGKGLDLIWFVLSLTLLVCIKENSLIFITTLLFFLSLVVLTDMAGNVFKSPKGLLFFPRRILANFRFAEGQ